MARYIDMNGQRFGRLTVIQWVGTAACSRSALWFCKCDCGREITTTAQSLRQAGTKSCGCLQRERARQTMTKHGMYQSRTYTTWESMIGRCTNPLNAAYKHYGGRGVHVCKRWRKFENFLADMGERPARRSLERRDNDGNYEPGNCCWATKREQLRNRRNTRFYELAGRKQILPDWAEEYGIHPGTVRSRLRYGWTLEKALTEPVGA